MRFLVLGKGAREHALAWKIGRSNHCREVLLSPGNAGASLVFDGEPSELGCDFGKLAAFVKERNIDVVVVGPEAYLADGLADQCREAGIACFGPVKEGAKLESSKSFAKEVMRAAKIPTASYELVEDLTKVEKIADQLLREKGKAVIKADGLASGKGVFVCTKSEDICDAVSRLSNQMKAAASSVVVEEFLEGRECSYFCMLGGSEVTEIGFAVDFKRLSNNDEGPNTGGMGCYTPVPWLPQDASQQVRSKIVEPLQRELTKRAIDYCGFLYVGLMWGEDGPNVVEFNVRLGDPEAQALAVASSADWAVSIARATSKISLQSEQKSNLRPSVCVVMSSADYPYGEGEANHGELPTQILTRNQDREAVFTAAVERKSDKLLATKSGRVASVVASDKSLQDARKRSYELVDQLTENWPGAHFRSDIAKRVSDEHK